VEYAGRKKSEYQKSWLAAEVFALHRHRIVEQHDGVSLAYVTALDKPLKIQDITQKVVSLSTSKQLVSTKPKHDR
jgi:hypothetical protein